MKAIFALLLTLALVNSSLVAKHPLDFSIKRSIMNVMMEVESKLKTNSPLDTVKEVLNEFKGAVNEEQVDHDDVYGAQKVECDSELAYRNTEVLDSSAALRDANQQLKTCGLQKNKAESQLARNDDTLIQNNQHLSLVDDVRRQETAGFNKAHLTFNDAVNAIDDALDLCAHIEVDTAALVQLARVSGNLIRHAVKLGKTAAYKPALAQIAALSTTQVDQSAVERLVQLLETLRDNVSASFESYQQENAESLQAFNDQKDYIQKNVARLEANEQKLDERLENLGSCIATNSAVAQAQSNKLQRNKTLFDDATVLCSIFDNEYTATTAGRRQELVLVAELERLVERRFAEVE